MPLKKSLKLIVLIAFLATAAPVESQLTNISTRGLVLTDDDVQIVGFIVTGTDPRPVLIRARGPILADFGVPGELSDPVLQLFSGQTMIADNDDWETTTSLCQNSGLSCRGPTEITETGLDPCVGNMTSCFLESVIYVTLNPGPYTAIVSGFDGATGVGLVEVFEVGTNTARLTNISTRGEVGAGDDVMIGGFVIEGTDPKTVLIRARGPVLTDFGILGELLDPFLQLFSGQTVIARNDNWQTTDPLCGPPAVSCGGEPEITETGLDPCVGNMTGCSQEAAILVTLPPGPYTAIVSGVGGGTGIGLVEVFEVNVRILETTNQTITATDGGTVTLPNGSKVAIPPGGLSTDQTVTLSLLSSSPTPQDIYTETTAIFNAGPSASQVVVVDTGFALPPAEMTVTLKVPDGLLDSLGQAFVPQLYVLAFSQNEDETLDTFAPLDSTFDPVTNELTALVFEWGFTSLRNGRGTYESVLLIGSFPAPSSSQPPSDAEFDFQTAGCTTPLFSPLLGLTPNELNMKIKAENHYGLRLHSIDKILKFHKGPDYSFSVGTSVTQVVPAADGSIVKIGRSTTYGQFVIVRHNDDSHTFYAHLQDGSLQIQDDNGNEVQYPQNLVATPPGCTPFNAGGSFCDYVPGLIPVTGGVTSIGIMGNTGKSDGRHLHFEFTAGKIIPGKKGMGGRLNAEECVTLDPPSLPPPSLPLSLAITSASCTPIPFDPLFGFLKVEISGTASGPVGTSVYSGFFELRPGECSAWTTGAGCARGPTESSSTAWTMARGGFSGTSTWFFSIVDPGPPERVIDKTTNVTCP